MWQSMFFNKWWRACKMTRQPRTYIPWVWIPLLEMRSTSSAQLPLPFAELVFLLSDRRIQIQGMYVRMPFPFAFMRETICENGLSHLTNEIVNYSSQRSFLHWNCTYDALRHQLPVLFSSVKIWHCMQAADTQNTQDAHTEIKWPAQFPK